MPRGGRRAGKPGVAYPNRSDLSMNKGPTAVANYAPGNPYGTGTELTRAQQAVPVSSPAPPGPTAGPQPPPGLEGLLGASGPSPGQWGDFARMTERPNEPISHGLPIGPGGGPEVMSNPVARPALHVLQMMANQPYASDELRTLLNILQG